MMFQTKYHRVVICVYILILYILFRYFHQGFTLTSLHESFMYVTVVPFLVIHYMIQTYHIDVFVFQFYLKRTKKIWIQTFLYVWISSIMDMIIFGLSIYIIFQYHMDHFIEIHMILHDMIYTYLISMILSHLSRYRMISYLSYGIIVFKSLWLPYVHFFYIPDTIETLETWMVLGALAIILSIFKLISLIK